MKRKGMTRRLFALSMAAVLAAGLTACGGAQGGDGDDAEGSAGGGELHFTAEEAATLEGWGKAVKEQLGGTEITVALASHPSSDAFQQMSTEFTELTGISVLGDVVEETSLKSKQLMDGGSYDVMMVDAFWMNEYASKNVLVPISEYTDDETKTQPWFDYEDIMPAFRNGIAGAGGVNYGIPTAGETRFIAYRTDLFEKYGKEPPKTMDEFLELARFFNGREDGLYGVSMRAQRGIHFASGWMSLMYNFGGGFLDQSTLGGDAVTVTCTTPETVESLQYYVDLMACAPPDVGTYTHEEALGAFLAGKTAMWLDATALAGQITDPASSTVADKVAFVPTPTGPAGDGAALAGWNLGISANSAHKDAAWAFISYMASREKVKEYVQHGGVATRASAFEDPELQESNPSYEAQKQALESANGLVEKGLSWIPQIDSSTQILEIAGGYGSSVLAGDMTAEDACGKMQKEIEDLINQ